MSAWLQILNGGAVSLFGSVLSAAFCGALDQPKSRRLFWCIMAVIALAQGGVYAFWDADFHQRIYPLLIHLPLLLALCALTRRFLWPLICILIAYLCCQLRRWLGLLAAELLSGGAQTQAAAELLVTLPLLLLLLRFAAPAIRRASEYAPRVQCQLGVIPALYYIFDYLTRVYTDLLTRGDPVAVEFMSFACCVAYLAYLLHSAEEDRARADALQLQNSLRLQLTQAVREIDALRSSQELASRYRHDLRHHLQYVSACIRNGQDGQAQRYISGICQEIEAQKVQRYCENETANLILSAFAGRAEKSGVRMEVRGALPAFILVGDSDLCVLLSNALENALHACAPLAAAGRTCVVSVEFYQREEKFFLQVQNPFEGALRFDAKGVPVSDRPGHGMGVQSICSIVERRGGVCAFSARDGVFTLRLSC